MKLDPRKFEGNKLHVIDVSGVARTKWWSYQNFSYNVEGKEEGTGAIFAVMELFKTIPIKEDILFCFDFGGNDRKDEYEGYKSNRPQEGLADYYRQMSVLREILIQCGFEVLGQTGYEGDDFVAGAVERYKSDYDHVFIYANDYDFAQLIDNNVYLKNTKSKGPDITRGSYEKDLEIPYNTSNLYKATVGDGSDRIKGIKGFGKAAFKKFIAEIAKEYNLVDIRKDKLEEKIIKEYVGFNDEKKDQALQSLRVVLPRIPHNYHFEDLLNKEIDMVRFKWFLKRYGLNSILKAMELRGE